MTQQFAWASRPLGELVENGDISYGIVQPGADTPGGVPVVRVKDVRDGRIDSRSQIRVDPDISARHSRTVLRGGELLVSIVGTVGESAVVPGDMAGWNVARAIAVIRPVDISPRWLRLCLQTAAVRQAFDSMLNTTVQATLNLADLKRLRIPVPPEPVREAIAEVLGALDDKIAANHAIVTTSDRLAAALTRASLKPARVTLSEVAEITMGSSPPGTSYNEVREGVVFYQGVRDFGVRFPTNRVWTTSPARMAAKDDSLVSVRAPVGHLNLAAEETCIGRGLASARSTRGTPMSLFHLLRDAPEIWAPYEAEGTVFGSINKKQLESLNVPTVDPDKEAGLEAKLAALEGSIACVLTENSQLAATRDALLPLLMSGKVRVKDAEQQLEGVV